MEENLIYRWSNSLALCAIECCMTQRSRHYVSGSTRATLPICKLGCGLSYRTNFPSELTTADIKHKSIQKKDNRKKKIFAPSPKKNRWVCWKQSVGVSHLSQVNNEKSSRPIRKKLCNKEDAIIRISLSTVSCHTC